MAYRIPFTTAIPGAHRGADIGATSVHTSVAGPEPKTLAVASAPVGVVSESGRLRQGAGGYPRGDRRQSVLMLPTLFEVFESNYSVRLLFISALVSKESPMHKAIGAFLLALAILVGVSQSAEADFLLTLRLDPNVYTVNAGGQITLRGFFTTSDALTFTYDREFLFGLTSISPHLGIVAGSVLSSTDFNPPVGGVSFQNIFGNGGYLGPTPIIGPTVTTISDLRTFVMPTGTQAGTYDYSYGVDLFPPIGSPPGTILFDTSLRINVVPAPSTFLLLAAGLLGPLGYLWRRRQWTAMNPMKPENIDSTVAG